eukprot:gene14293-30413_t
MSISGLLGKLNVENESNFTDHIRVGSVLLIDGNKWVFHIIDNCADNKFHQYGDSCDVFVLKLRSEISKLTNKFGLNVKIYFDGNISKMIKTTTLKRFAKDNEAGPSLSSYCQGSDISCGRQDCLLISPLYLSQMCATLQELKVEIIMFKPKANLEIAKAYMLMKIAKDYASMKDDSTSYYCYTNDSDFLLMKDCPCVNFDSLSEPTDYSDGCMAVTRSRKDVAANLDISESNLVELALLIGNDFTRVFPRSQLQLNIETSYRIPGDGNCSKESIALMLKCIKSLPEDFKLTSSDTSLQTALYNSRALYGLKDISKFCDDISTYIEVFTHTGIMLLCDE